ncbi:hypothetical protein ACX3YG_00685 [Pseudomonas wadenswilerensis]
MFSTDGKQMGARHGNGQQPGSGQPAANGFGISRSRFGWLSVRFDGGASYLAMVDTLKEMADQHGHLVRRGEKLSGAEWLRRIGQSGVQLSEHQLRTVRTLMEEM